MVKPKQFRFGFGPKFWPGSVSVFWFSPFSVFRLKHYFWPNRLFWLNRPIFAAHFSIKSTAKTAFHGRNKVIRPKQAISSEKVIRPKFRLFPGGLVSVSAKKLFRLTTR